MFFYLTSNGLLNLTPYIGGLRLNEEFASFASLRLNEVNEVLIQSMGG